MELSKRDILVSLMAILILLVVMVPSLLLITKKDPDLSISEQRMKRSIPLVSDPIHKKELKHPSFWKGEAQGKLRRDLLIEPVKNKAKNVIFFMGDGMGISTLTAARILKGQQSSLVGGEQSVLEFEKFPYLALSRTYCYDNTVADSACSGTAYLSGVKANKDTLGVSAKVEYEDCAAQLVKENQVKSIIFLAQEAGKATGVVTTDSLTGASPASTYAHSASRDWENNQGTPAECEDIAKQLVRHHTGRNINVLMGGGRKHFNNSDNNPSGRTDGLDLISEWLTDKQNSNSEAAYVKLGSELALMNMTEVDYLLGIFNTDIFTYHLDTQADENLDDQPTLDLMTKKAIELLSKDGDGFVLFVEGAEIDKAHHENKARKALDEVLELEKAIQVALNMTSLEETLIIVTADHSHSLTVSGYPARGTDILGYGSPYLESLPYSTLMYATGPGQKEPGYDLRNDPEISSRNFMYPSTVSMSSSAHQGEDVIIYAVGPQAHQFRGLIQQFYIPHLISYAACMGDGLSFCD